VIDRQGSGAIGPVDDAQDLAEGDHVGRFQQQVTALLAATADDDALVLEVEQDLLQELLRNFCCAAMSEIITGSPSSASARTVSARSAYFAFCVIISNHRYVRRAR
jgi:hypothetical protein